MDLRCSVGLVKVFRPPRRHYGICKNNQHNSIWRFVGVGGDLQTIFYVNVCTKQWEGKEV